MGGLTSNKKIKQGIVNRVRFPIGGAGELLERKDRMTYTKGPLKITGPSSGDGPDGGDYAIYAGGVIIGEAIHRADEDEYRDAEANARLWAASPELLAALEASESLLKRLSVCNRDFTRQIDEACKQAHTAIAKAKGERK